MTIVLDNCPKMPDIELINMNIDAVVIICFGLPARIKKRIGLKNIPPPIPTTPDINPKSAPISTETNVGIFL